MSSYSRGSTLRRPPAPEEDQQAQGFPSLVDQVEESILSMDRFRFLFHVLDKSYYAETVTVSVLKASQIIFIQVYVLISFYEAKTLNILCNSISTVCS